MQFCRTHPPPFFSSNKMGLSSFGCASWLFHCLTDVTALLPAATRNLFITLCFDFWDLLKSLLTPLNSIHTQYFKDSVCFMYI